MVLRTLSKSTLQNTFRWIVVLPFFLLSMMAPGTMAAHSSSGIEIVICTDGGAKTVVIGPDGTPVEKPHEPCFWGLHSDISALAGVVPDFERTLFARPQAELQRQAIWRGRIASHIHTARAPPPFL